MPDVKVLGWLATGIAAVVLIFVSWLRGRDARIRAQAQAEGRAQVLRSVVTDSHAADTAILEERERETKAAQVRAQAHAADRKRLDPAAWLNDKGRPGK